MKDHAPPQVLDGRADARRYLHRDFHGALCYAIKYLDETYGPEAVRDYLLGVGRTVYAPLAERLARTGLVALADHFRGVFEREDGAFDLRLDGDVLTLEVARCPAVDHLRRTNQLHTEAFCRTTVWVNRAVCAAAGYACTCVYEPGRGRCRQQFWKLPAAARETCP